MNAPPRPHPTTREDSPNAAPGPFRACASMGLTFDPPPPGRGADHAGGLRRSCSRARMGSLYGRSPEGTLAGLQRADGADGAAGPLSGGRRGASGGGGADGGPLRQARGRGDAATDLTSRVDVAPDGYAWWYVDGVSDDGTRAVSVIGFIGSVFSPWYRWSGRRDPQNHCCLNVATYGPGGRFTMTDRGRAALRQTPRPRCRSGPVGCTGPGGELVIDVDEIVALAAGQPRAGARITPDPAAR